MAAFDHTATLAPATQLQAQDLSIIGHGILADATPSAPHITTLVGATLGRNDAISVSADTVIDGRTLTTGLWYQPEDSGPAAADVNDLVKLAAATGQDRIFASLTDVPVPNKGSIAAFAALDTSARFDTTIYTTGNDTATDPELNAWLVDQSGNVTPTTVVGVIEETDVLFTGLATNTTANEVMTLGGYADMDAVLNAYEFLEISVHEAHLRNYSYNQRWRCADLRVDALAGNVLMGFHAWYSTTEYSQWVNNFELTHTQLTYNSNGKTHRNLSLRGIKMLAVDPQTVVIPAPDIILTATGGLNTIDGAATRTVTQGQSTTIQLDTGAGQQLDTASLDSGTLKIIDRISGMVSVLTDAASSVITFTIKASVIVQSANLIGHWDATGPPYLDIDGTYVTGIDFTRCSTIKLALGISSSSSRATVSEAHIILGQGTASMQFQFYSGGTVYYVNANITDEATGTIALADEVANGYLVWIEGWSSGPSGAVVPTGYVAATARTITQVGGTGLINGATSAPAREGLVETLEVGLSPGKQLETVVNSGPGQITIVDRIAGHVSIIAGNADDVLTITEKDTLVVQSLNVIGRWDFDAVNRLPQQLLATAGEFQIATGIDFTRCSSIRLFLATSATAFRLVVAESQVVLDGGLSKLQFTWHAATTVYYANAYIATAEAAAGTLRIDPVTTDMYLMAVEGISSEPTGAVVPTGYDATATIDLTANAGANTINGLNPLPITTKVNHEVVLEMAGGQEIDTYAIDNGAIALVDRRRGLVSVVVSALNAVITYTTKQAATTGGTLRYLSVTPLIINSILPDTGGSNGKALWAGNSSAHTLFDPDGLIDANGYDLNLPQGIYEAITNVRANSSLLTETGVYLDDVELSHLDAPYVSGSGIPRTIGSTTQPLIFEVPAAGGKMDVRKQAASGTLSNFAFTLKQLPVETEVVLAGTVVSTAMTITCNAGANTVYGAARQGQLVRMQIDMVGVNQQIDLATPPTIGLAGASVSVVDEKQALVDVFSPVGVPTTADITLVQKAIPQPTIEYVLGTDDTHGGAVSNTNHAAFDAVKVQIGTNISLDTTTPYTTTAAVDSIGRITIQGATGKYKLHGAIAVDMAANDYIGYGWWDVDAGVVVPAGSSASFSDGTLGAGLGPIAMAFVEPAVATRYELRVLNQGGLAVQYSNATWGRSYFEAERIAE